MSYLSSVPALLKLSHVKNDPMGTSDHPEQTKASYNLPVKQYKANYNAPTLGDILRGADTVTSITINPSLLSKLADSEFKVSDNFQKESLLGIQAAPTYNSLLTSSGNTRPATNKSTSSISVKSKTPVNEDSESIAESMKLKGSKYHVKDDRPKDKNNNGSRRGLI